MSYNKVDRQETQNRNQEHFFSLSHTAQNECAMFIATIQVCVKGNYTNSLQFAGKGPLNG